MPESRELATDERQLINRLLQETFVGRDALKAQMADVRVVVGREGGDRTLVFLLSASNGPRANTCSRVPVDAVMEDIDGVYIEILFHVVDGYARELEIYRVDGSPIKRQFMDGPLMVNWKPC
jgi:hypothetical protein